MDSDDKFLLILWVTIIISITTIICVCVSINADYNKKALELGYIEVQKYGAYSTMWVKTSQNKEKK